MKLEFDRGTVVLTGVPADVTRSDLPGVLWDPRSRCTRAPAYQHASIRAALAQAGLEVKADATAWIAPAGRFAEVPLRPYQAAALDAWNLAGKRGLLVLPTGAGKTRVACAAIVDMRAPTLCIVPTRVLLHQWLAALRQVYAGGVGILGDGRRALKPITVATSESAYRHMARIGHRFALLVVDEAHHFGSGRRDEALEMCLAPHRLGLTATPLADGDAAEDVQRLIGPQVYRLGVSDLAGNYLADLRLVTLELPLNPQEKARHDREHGIFRDAHGAFMRAHPEATFQAFAKAAAHSEAGRRALAAFYAARRIASYTREKSRVVGRLLRLHREGRTLIFTADNQGAYAIAREHLVMPVTCDIGPAERDRTFEHFRAGRLRALVSARVLNEGVDVPEADVAIVVAGKLGEREHVQRVGRVLRKPEGSTDKQALVYELLSRGTAEVQRGARKRRSLVA